MCLIDNKRFRFTLKPIKVYIVLTKDNFDPSNKNIKYSRFNIQLNGFPIKIENCNDPEVKAYYNVFSKSGYAFDKGFFKSYLKNEEAEEHLQCFALKPILTMPEERKILLETKWDFSNGKNTCREYALSRIPIYGTDKNFKIVEGWVIGRYAKWHDPDCLSLIYSRILILNL